MRRVFVVNEGFLPIFCGFPNILSYLIHPFH
jgi:hypothetical protein